MAETTPYPVTEPAPAPTVTVVDQPWILKWASESAQQEPIEYSHTQSTASIGPSQDPAVPQTLAKINYRPLTTARLGATIPIGYGRFKTGGLIARAKQYGNELLVLVVWCEGEVDAVEAVFSGTNDITLLTQIAAYTGTQSQTGDSTIATVFGQADDLKGICYSVLSLRAVDSLDLSAIIRDKKVYDPRVDDTIPSRNAALCLADFIGAYKDWTIDWAAAEYAADYCDDEIVPGIARWEVNMPLADQKSPDEWISVLAEYANCFVFVDGGVARIIPDEPRAVDHVLTASDIIQDSLDLRKLGQHDVPTQVFCEYTVVPASGEWTEAEEYTPDPDESVPLRITNLRMLGYQESTQARRKAIQFLNYAASADLVGSVGLFDAGARIVKGDIVSITHPTGLTNKEFRVLDCVPMEKGRWRADLREYSDSLYSEEVVANPDIPDTDLPLVTDVPDGPAISEVREVLFVDETGITHTRFEIRFDGDAWPFVRNYRVQVSAGSVVVMDVAVVHLGSGIEHVVATPPTAQGVSYTVKVWVVSSLGEQSSTPSEATKTGSGKTIPPTNPSSLTGREAGGMVALSWSTSIDTDLRGYQVKRLSKSDYDAAASDSARWDHVNVVTEITRIDATRCVLDAQPAGQWYYMVKAEDFAGNFSVGFAAKLITVTIDQASASLSESLDYDSGDTTGMYYYDNRVNAGVNGGEYLTTFTGSYLEWEDFFTNTDEWEDMFSNTDIWGKYNSAGQTYSEWWDLGEDRTGNWSISAASIVETDGTDYYYGYLVLEADYPEADPDGFLGTDGNGTGRYARMSIGPEYPGSAAYVPADEGWDLTIKLPFDITFHGVRVFDSGRESVPGTGQPASVTFVKTFGSPPIVKAQLVGSTPGFANPDNVTTTGFDLYVWDTTGTEMAGDVDWTADGVA